jgi:hypothetical protein
MTNQRYNERYNGRYNHTITRALEWNGMLTRRSLVGEDLRSTEVGRQRDFLSDTRRSTAVKP